MKERIRHQAREVASAVRAAPAEERAELFYRLLRGSDVPYVAVLEPSAGDAFLRAFDALFILAGASLPLAIGFTMHQYMFGALTAAPIPAEPFAERRARVVDLVCSGRLLVGVSSLGDNHKLPGGEHDVVVEERADGHLIARGRKLFLSMARETDLLAMTAKLTDGRPGFFVCPIRGEATVRLLGARLPGPLELADTQGVRFEDHEMPPEVMLSDGEILHQFLTSWTTSWFEALVAGTYLGGAARALDELRTFARGFRTRDGTLLGELDGFVVEAGRLALDLRTAIALASSFGPALDRTCALARSPDVPYAAKAEAVNELSLLSSLIKYHATRSAEDVVGRVRRLMGTRAMHAGQVIAELSSQIVFGPMHPMLAAELERNTGVAALAEEPGPGLFEHITG